MSVQEPRNQFERESVEDEIEESQDSVDESLLADSDTSLSESESVDVPSPTGETDLPPESSQADETDEDEVPAIDSMPVSSSDELPAPEPTDGPAWYVIHCYSGYENKVRHNLEQRIETMGMKDKIFDVVIPTQEEIEVKDGKRRTVERHIFPGYVLVNMALTEESWYVVRNTPKVTGFVGMGNNPTPLRPEEVAQIVKRMEAEAPTVKVTFKVGERVRIVDGPFNDFRGVVSEIDMERTKVRVMVSFFGRETPVELDFLQVEKA
jgi:transcriptional antiterminator NusG